MLFVESTRTRTITRSPRSAVDHNADVGLRADCALSCSVLNTRVLVNRRKGQSAFVHLVTAETLSGSAVPGTASADTENSMVGIGWTIAGRSNADIKTMIDIVSKEKAKVGLGETMTKERRGRSVFRSKDHKRSRARSPSPRRAIEHSEIVNSGKK